MNVIGMWIMVAILGVCMGFGGGYVTGGTMGMMIGMFSTIMVFMPIMMMVAYAKNNGFITLYRSLKDFEKFIFFPDKFGRLKIFVMNTVHDGILYKKKYGLIDDKGTEFAFGDNRMSIALPKKGVTVDLKDIQYFSMLKKEDGIQDYDHAIKQYLGESVYTQFCEKFRKNPKPDIYDINAELQWLVDYPIPRDMMEKDVFGETVSFVDELQHLKYMYHPQAMENAVDTEKIWTKREQAGYKDMDKRMSTAKAIVIILFGLMVFLIVVSVIDWSNMGGLFGG